MGDAFALGLSGDEVFELTKIDPWFLAQIEEIVKIEHGAGRPQRSTSHRRGRRCSQLKQKRLLRPPARRSCSAPTETAMRETRRALERAPGVQARRHLRGRVRVEHRLHVLDLRGRVRGESDGQARRS